MSNLFLELRRRHPYRVRAAYTLIGALAALLALIAYQQLAPVSRERVTEFVAALPDTPASGGIAIAVLPFANLSGDRAQEFFSDGMTEEVTSALAKVKGLRVVGRSSAFQFKGQNQDVRAIGQSLGARYVIAGSVQKDGPRIRLGAQLTEVSNGANVWIENYERPFADVFATEEDIVKAVASALHVPLGLRRGEALIANRTDDLGFYEEYLQARALVRGRAISQALAILEPAVARDPNYAPAWVLLAQAYAFIPGYEMGVSAGPIANSRRVVQNSLDRAEAAARKAIALDPNYARGYAALGHVQAYRQEWGKAEDSFRQALMLDAEDPDALHFYALMLMGAGHIQHALDIRERLRTLEPFVAVYNVMTALVLQANEKSADSIPLLQTVPLESAVGYYRNLYLAMVYAGEGRYGMAADALLAIPEESRQVPRRSIEHAAGLLRTAPTQVRTPEALPDLEGELNFVYAYIGAMDRVLDAPERNLEIGLANGTVNRSVWRPIYAPLRKTGRFKDYLRKANLVDYWRERGWPDLCRPVGADDFTCD